MTKFLILAATIIFACSPMLRAQSTTSNPTPDKGNALAAPSPASSPSLENVKPAPPVATSNPGRSAPLPPEKASPVSLTLFAKAPVIDGKLDDEAWKTAAVFKDFYQWRPSDSAAASARTEVFAGYDSRFIYFAFHAYDDPAKVRASVAKRDSIFDDDVVGLLLDTFNDKRRAYELFFNPLGIQQDGFLTEGGNDDFSIDIVMESKGSWTPDG